MTTINNITTELTSLSVGDELVIYDASGTETKRMKVSTLFGGWRDLRSALIGAKTKGVSDPKLEDFGPSGGVMQYKFDVGDEVFLAFHFDHDIKQGSTFYPHVHWSTDGTSTNTVKWAVEYTIANRENQAAFPVPTILNIEEAAKGTAWAHMVSEDAVGISSPEIDALMIVHLTRVTNGGTENTDGVFGLFMDMHYECQMYGTPSRSPDYYTAPA